MSRRLGRPITAAITTVACVLALAGSLTVASLVVAGSTSPAAASRLGPVDDYASYQPQRRCVRRARPGTVALARWVARRGGRTGGLLRSCDSGGTSEHKDGRAIDWTLDASKRSDRRVARDFLRTVFGSDRQGNTDAKARRMGIMYVIWDDHMYSAWDGFEKEPYLSSSCRRVKRCSTTLRHRDHVHISLSRKGAAGRTSWYAGRVG